MMNVDYEKLEAWLTEHGYDGLYCSPTCGCLRNDLAPCGEVSESCRPGVKVACNDCGDGCEHREVYGWCIVNKPDTIDGYDIKDFLVEYPLELEVVIAISESNYNGRIKIVQYPKSTIFGNDMIYEKFLEFVDVIESEYECSEDRPGLYHAKMIIDSEDCDLEIGDSIYILK
jgi:hypothetical protein